MCLHVMHLLRVGRVTGYAYFKDIARGRLSGGDAAGFLKLVSRADEPTRHVVIGVQIIGGSSCRWDGLRHEDSSHFNTMARFFHVLENFRIATTSKCDLM